MLLVFSFVLPIPVYAINEESQTITQTLSISGEDVTVTYNPEEPYTVIVNGTLYERKGNQIFAAGELIATVNSESRIEPRTSWVYLESTPYDEDDFNDKLDNLERVINLAFREKIINLTIDSILGCILLFLAELGPLQAILGVVAGNIFAEANVDLRFGNSDIVYTKEVVYAHDFVPFTRRNEFTFYKDEDCTDEVPDTALTCYSVWA